MATVKKKDRDKIDNYIESIIKGYSLCFNPEEVSNNYLKRFANMIYDSAIYNNELLHLNLNILEGISDCYDGIEDEELDSTLRSYFVKRFQSRMKEELVVRLEEIKERKKREKEAEEEAKGKVGGKRKRGD